MQSLPAGLLQRQDCLPLLLRRRHAHSRQVSVETLLLQIAADRLTHLLARHRPRSPEPCPSCELCDEQVSRSETLVHSIGLALGKGDA